MTRSITASEQAAIRARLQDRYGTLGRSTPSKAARAKLEATRDRAPDAQASPMLVSPLDLPRPPFVVRALASLSYGATAQSISEFNALGTTDTQRLANYVDWQLDWANIDDSAVETRLLNAG